MNQAAEAIRVGVPGADKGGVWVRMGNHEYKIAPLNFKALRTLSDSIGELSKLKPGAMPTADQMNILARIAHASLTRNYPTMTEDDVAEDLDFGNFSEVLNAVLGASNIKAKEETPGEAMTLQS